MALENLLAGPAVPTQSAAPAPVNGTARVASSLEQLLNPSSRYIQNARQRGLEVAATRGGINSSIAAGSAERAALDAAAPLVQQATGLDQTGINAQYENWLSQQNFGRAIRGQMFSNSLNMLNSIQQYGLEDPELYTPDVLSGFSNFFQQNVNDILKRYFGAGT